MGPVGLRVSELRGIRGIVEASRKVYNSGVVEECNFNHQFWEYIYIYIYT